MESAWRSPAPPWAREKREEACRAGRGRGRLVWRAGFVGASRAGAGRPGGRASRVGMGTVSLSRFQMQMWRGGARGRRGGRQGRERATARSVAKDGWGIGFGGGGKEIRRRRRRASVSNATDDNPGGRGRTVGRSTTASAAVIVCVLTAQSLGSAALSASAAVGIAGGPTSQRERGDLVLRL